MVTTIEPWDTILRAGLLSSLALLWVVFAVRVVGLRAFSKMTAFDFVATVAIGSLLAGASQATDWPGFFQATLAIAVLLGCQFIIARLRQSSPKFSATFQNDPVLLMRDGEIIQSALDATRVSKDDVIAKLREANVMKFTEVRAVVLETTGDISVLHGNSLDDRLLKGVSQDP